MNSAGTFKNQPAPCGKAVDGERYEEVMVTKQHCYACGCVTTRHEYHDGSVSRRVVHHNGKILVDELLAAQYPEALNQ